MGKLGLGKKEWVYDSEALRLTFGDGEEITEEEAMYVIEHREVPINSYESA